MDFVLLIAGLILILAGANFLTDGSSDLARRFKISEFIIGVTIIGIGTSAPELVVSIGAALKGSGDIAAGNVIGSNIFNVLVILGITAIIYPLPLSSNNVKKDIPFGVLASIILLLITSDRLLGDSEINWISRTEGLLLFSLFIIFIASTIFSSKKDNSSAEDNTQSSRHRPLWLSFIFVSGGLAALVYGGDLFLDSALNISRRYGISEAVIAITLMAGGTSMPELASCVVSAIKKKPQLALGNILGSNISNIFLVLGTSASISPLYPGDIKISDLLMVILTSVLLFTSALLFKKRLISRTEGIIFLAIYGIYIWILLSNI